MGRPTLEDLVTRAVGDLSGRLGAFPFRSPENVIGVLHAGALHEIYGYAEGVKRRALPSTADPDGLAEWGDDWGVDPLPDVLSSGAIRITAPGGTIIIAGAPFFAAGRRYVCTATYIFVLGGTQDVAAAASGAGAEYDLAAGVEMTIIDGYALPPTSAVAAPGGFTGGFHETPEAYRQRVLARMREPDDTGDLDDYVRWALEAPSDYEIYRAWASRSPTVPGQVDVWVVAPPPDMDATPAGLVSDVQAYLDAKRVIGATALVASPTIDAVNVTVKITPPSGGSVSPQADAAVEAAVTALFVAIAEPGNGVDKGVLHRWQLERAVLAAGYSPATVSLPVAIRTIPDWGHMNWLGSLSVI